MLLKVVLVILFLAVQSVSYGWASDGSQNPFVWDLSYQKLFNDNEVPRNDSVAKFFRDAANEKSEKNSGSDPHKSQK